MATQRFISLLGLAVVTLGATCLVAPKKASAEPIFGILGNRQIACDTVSQICYYSENGEWLPFTYINDLSRHQSMADTCQKAADGNSFAATLATKGGYDCSLYGYNNAPIYRTGDEVTETIDEIIRILQSR